MARLEAKDRKDGYFYRQCQECGNYQTDNAPEYNKDLPIVYERRKCKHCKSEALDYGSEFFSEDIDE